MPNVLDSLKNSFIAEVCKVTARTAYNWKKDKTAPLWALEKLQIPIGATPAKNTEGKAQKFKCDACGVPCYFIIEGGVDTPTACPIEEPTTNWSEQNDN